MHASTNKPELSVAFLSIFKIHVLRGLLFLKRIHYKSEDNLTVNLVWNFCLLHSQKMKTITPKLSFRHIEVTRLWTLLQTFCRTHWHVLLLTFLGIVIGYATGQSCQGTQETPSAIDMEDDQWEVERIESKCRVGRQLWYLIKWKGFSPSENSWQKKENIHPELVADFESRLRRGRLHWQIIEPTNWVVG